MMKMQTVLATCFAAAGVLQLAATAPAATAAALTSDVLRTVDGVAVTLVDAEADDASSFWADAGEDDEVGYHDPIGSGAQYHIELAKDIEYHHRPNYVMADAIHAADKRDGASNYVYLSPPSALDTGSVFTALFDSYEGFWLFQYTDPRGGKPRYLAVHDKYEADVTKDGDFRLIVHEDRDRASLWDIYDQPAPFTYRITLAVNHDRTGEEASTEGMNWRVSSDDPFSDGSEFVTVTEEWDDADYFFIFRTA